MSRKQALYAYLHAQARNAKSIPVGGGGDSSEFDDYVPVDTSDQLKNLLSNPDTPEVKVTISKSLEITGDKPIVIEPGKTLKLNLTNGAEITSSGATDPDTKDSVIAVKNGGELVIDGNGAIVGGAEQYCGIKLTVKESTRDAESKLPAKLTVNGGTIIGKYYAITGNGSRSDTEVVINGGVIKATEENDSTAIFNPQGNSSVTINGGEFSGAMCVYIKSGKLTINGGKFTANGLSGEYRTSRNGFNNTGDCIVVDNCGYPGEEPSAEIVGGSFNSEHNQAFASYASEGYERITGFVDKNKVEVTEAVESNESVYIHYETKCVRK